MKKIILTLAIVLVGYSVYAQTNTFPTSGNAGVGTTTPNNILNIVANSPSYLDPQYSSGLRINDASNTTAIVTGVVADFNNGYIQTVQPNVSWASRSLIFQPMGGYVGIGTKSPAVMLDVNGVINSSSYMSNAAGVYVDGGTSLGINNHAGGNYLSIRTSGIDDRMIVDPNGNVGISTTNTHGYKFAVNGSAIATSMTVMLYTSWPDYVFKPTYNLPSLIEVETYIDQNHHLPDMPSEAEVAKDGINLGEMNKLLVKKVEELTLYQIEQQKKSEQQEARIAILEKTVSKLITNK
jgi:hypothetical protein